MGVDPGYAWQIFTGEDGQLYARFRYRGDIMFTSEGYRRREDAQLAIATVRARGPEAKVEDLTRG